MIDDNKVFKTENEQWARKCPKCLSIIVYKGKSAKSNALRDCNKRCHSCANRKPHTEQTKIKLSKIRQGKYTNINNPFYGKHHSSETKIRLSIAHKGLPSWNKGKKLTEIHKNNISLSRKGKNTGKIPWIKGKHHSEETKKKMSLIHKQRYSNINERKKTSDVVKVAMHKPDVRKKHIKALTETKYLGKPTDKGQIELLEKWNRLGFNFEPNYQVHTDVDLFYIDGYDKEKNVVLEYDAKYHNKLQQKQKDLIRQQKIINILKPKKFWRYDAVNKKWRNVL